MAFACINPDAIWGPSFTPHLNLSLAVLLEMVDGTLEEIPNGFIGGVDVRDVAEAHLSAFRALRSGRELSCGRYLMTVPFVHFEELAALLKQRWPLLSVPTQLESVAALGFRAVPPTADCTPVATELGVHMRGMQEILESTIETLISHGHLTMQPMEQLSCTPCNIQPRGELLLSCVGSTEALVRQHSGHLKGAFRELATSEGHEVMGGICHASMGRLRNAYKYSFRDLYHAAFPACPHGGLEEEAAICELQSLTQTQRNTQVRLWAAKAGWLTEEQLGGDGQMYCAFSPEAQP